MKIKNSDNWAYKMGLVGFDRILKHNKDSLNLNDFNYVVHDDYIEFDDALFDNFEQYYFNYFLDTYNVEKEMCSELDYLLLHAKNQNSFINARDKIVKKLQTNNDKVKKILTPSYLQAQNIENDIKTIKKYKNLETLLISLDSYDNILEELNFVEERDIITSIISEIKSEDNFKVQLKLCKDFIKTTNAKIKKLKLPCYTDMLDITKLVKKSTDLDDLTSLIEAYKVYLHDDHVNTMNTLNKFKQILSSNFFGQAGFLNIRLATLSYAEQQENVKSKYVAPVINYLYLKTISETTTGKELLNILNKMKDYEDIISKKFLKTIETKCKVNTDSQINCFEHNDLCILCEEEYSIGHVFTESSFMPLAVSNSNILNLFWDLNTTRPICPICQLILFCAPAGAINIFKSYMNTTDFSDKSYQAFISQDGSLLDLISINNDFINRTFKNNSFDNSFGALMLNYLDVQRKVSVWQLQNILYIEFNVDYRSKNTKLNYKSIPYHVAKFLSKKENILLMKSIERIELQKEVLDNILLGRNLRNIIFKNTYDCIKYWKGSDITTILTIQKLLNLYKEGDEFMEVKSKDFAEHLEQVRQEGYLLRIQLYRYNKENKLDSIAYKLLNLAKARNAKDMFDILARLYLSYDMHMPYILLDIKKESVLDMEDIAHAFVAGLLGKYNHNANNSNTNTEIIKEN